MGCLIIHDFLATLVRNALYKGCPDILCEAWFCNCLSVPTRDTGTENVLMGGLAAGWLVWCCCSAMREDNGRFYSGVWLRIKTTKTSCNRANSYMILNVSTTMRPSLGKVVTLDFYIFRDSWDLNFSKLNKARLIWITPKGQKTNHLSTKIYHWLSAALLFSSPWICNTPSFSRRTTRSRMCVFPSWDLLIANAKLAKRTLDSIFSSFGVVQQQ